MSQVVVLIGYLLIIPSVIGVVASIGCGLASIAAGGAIDAPLSPTTMNALRVAHVPEGIIGRVEKGLPIDGPSLDHLPPAQRREVDAAIVEQQAKKGVAVAGGALGVGASVCSAAIALIGGLLGYLLIMKRTVLRCGSCNAVTEAA